MRLKEQILKIWENPDNEADGHAGPVDPLGPRFPRGPWSPPIFHPLYPPPRVARPHPLQHQQQQLRASFNETPFILGS